MTALACPHCGSVLICSPHQVGTDVPCPNCARTIPVPQQGLTFEEFQKRLQERRDRETHPGTTDTTPGEA